MTEFKIGDVVRLKCDDVKMVVENVENVGDGSMMVSCAYRTREGLITTSEVFSDNLVLTSHDTRVVEDYRNQVSYQFNRAKMYHDLAEKYKLILDQHGIGYDLVTSGE